MGNKLCKNPIFYLKRCSVGTWLGTSTKNPACACRVFDGQIYGHFQKELTMWSASFWWAHWWVLLKRTQHVPAGFLMGKLMDTFKKNSSWAWWVLCGQIDSELTMNSQCTHWVNTPLPSVNLLQPHPNTIIEWEFRPAFYRHNFVSSISHKKMMLNLQHNVADINTSGADHQEPFTVHGIVDYVALATSHPIKHRNSPHFNQSIRAEALMSLIFHRSSDWRQVINITRATRWKQFLYYRSKEERLGGTPHSSGSCRDVRFDQTSQVCFYHLALICHIY